MSDIKKRLESVSLEFDHKQMSALNNLLSIEKSVKEDELRSYFEEIYIPVRDGEIMLLHHQPGNPVTKKKILFVAGWGSTLESFLDLYQSIINKVEIYHILTREKNSSRIDISKTNMSVNQNARDIAAVIEFLGLKSSKDYIVGGACWGSSIILQGLIDHILPETVYVLFDPMHSLWFPKWLLRWIIPMLPIWHANRIKPIGKMIALFGMNEPVQKKRTGDFIDKSDLRKWKPAAIQANDFELIGNLSDIEYEVFIANGSRDKIHDQRYYPIIAKDISKGRFLFMKTDESRRELLIGCTLFEFAVNNSTDTLPESLKLFETTL